MLRALELFVFIVRYGHNCNAQLSYLARLLSRILYTIRFFQPTFFWPHTSKNHTYLCTAILGSLFASSVLHDRSLMVTTSLATSISCPAGLLKYLQYCKIKKILRMYNKHPKQFSGCADAGILPKASMICHPQSLQVSIQNLHRSSQNWCTTCHHCLNHWNFEHETSLPFKVFTLHHQRFVRRDSLTLSGWSCLKTSGSRTLVARKSYHVLVVLLKYRSPLQFGLCAVSFSMDCRIYSIWTINSYLWKHPRPQFFIHPEFHNSFKALISA